MNDLKISTRLCAGFCAPVLSLRAIARFVRQRVSRMGQVDDAVAWMDQAAQQNAALVENMAAA